MTIAPEPTTTITDRERFCAVLSAGPLLKADAIVVLCGEDAIPRLAIAEQLWKQGGAPVVVLSGGKHELPRWTGATQARLTLLGHGVAPDRIIVEDESQHTRDQAVAVAAMAKEQGWHRVLLVASAYHMPRAFLTFLHALTESEQQEKVHLLPVVPSHSPWWGSPDGMTETRLDLLAGEVEKVDRYAELGHVAPYAYALQYLHWWEGRP